MSLLLILLICLAVCCLIMTLVWAWAVRIKNAGVVDVFWAFNFPVIALLLYLLGYGWEVRKLIICIMVLAAGIRLGLHLYNRVIGHIHEEEGRYKQLRKEWAPYENRKFFIFFQFQAISNVVLSIPFLLIALNPSPEMDVMEFIGIFLWIVAFTGETVADWQLSHFKKNPEHKGKVCTAGLWNYSRHPNYFFQILMWFAYFLIAVTAPWGWIAIISPLIISYLILNVTGIPATEEQALRSKGAAYQAYQQSTSVLIPWFKKK